MSQEELSKAEKLKRRQEQLAKWKLRKGSTPVEDNVAPAPSKTDTEVEKEVETSDAEKKKVERLKKLEEWKRKKQQEANSPSPPTEAIIHPKQLRLDAWKKKKQESPAAIQIKRKNLLNGLTNPSKKPAISKSNRAFFEADDDTSPAPLAFKKPKIATVDYSQVQSTENAEDALDAFVDSLTTEETLPRKINSDSEYPKLAESDLEVSEDEDANRLRALQAKSLRLEKELAVIDHAQISYLPFRKNLYTESQIVGQLSEEEVQALRLAMDGIKATGKDLPRPIWEWSHLGLSSLIVSVIEDKLNYVNPTAIQSQALPAIMSGRDFLGIAKTGSGKTLAFVLPLLKHVQDQPPLAPGDGPIAVLLAPTRELALQIHKQLSHFTKRLNISACCCYGGTSIEPQIAELKKGSQVVVSTPGRLIDLLAANNGRVCNLRRVTYVVLDEADRMLDFGFEPQVKKIFSHIRPDRQSILFSATFARKMEALAKQFLQDPVEVIVGAISAVAEEVSQHIELFELSENESLESIAERKFEKLLEILAQYPEAKKLIFVETQGSADNLLMKLLAKGMACMTIHGGKEQVDRKHAVKEFSKKSSGVDVLIATSIAARGLDVKELDLVINYDPANHMEDYVHRVGRTGRAGRRGDAYTLVTSDQVRPIADLVNALRLSAVPENEIDPRLVQIRDTFLANVKLGKQKFRFGFGGKGLTKLDDIRNESKQRERKAFDPEGELKQETTTSQSVAIDLPEFTVLEGGADEISGPDKCKFHSRITINDLPQKARWIVVNADNLAQISEATTTSITNKGQYYPPGAKVPTTVKKGGKDTPAPPKLYLLIEGQTENAVHEANKLIRQKMIDGLESVKDDPIPAGRYTV